MNAFKTIFTITILLLWQICSASLIRDTLPESNVILKPAQALGTVKDLIQFDGCKQIVKIMESQIADLKSISQQKDQMLAIHETNAKNYQGIIANKDVILQAKDQQFDALNKKYKGSIRVGRFKVVVIVGLVVYGIYQSIK